MNTRWAYNALSTAINASALLALLLFHPLACHANRSSLPGSGLIMILAGGAIYPLWHRTGSLLVELDALQPRLTTLCNDAVSSRTATGNPLGHVMGIPISVEVPASVQ